MPGTYSRAEHELLSSLDGILNAVLIPGAFIWDADVIGAFRKESILVFVREIAQVKRIHFSVAPPDVTRQQKRNFLNVQVDAVGIGLASAAASFLPIFLTRLDATNTQIGLLTSMPALAGLILSIPIGSFLQRRRQIVPWFSAARLMVVSCYAITGLAGFFIPQQYMVQAILVIWAFATLPQTIVAVSFTVVMNEVAGPTHRYELMSRRWSILGLTTAVTTLLTGAGAGPHRISAELPDRFPVLIVRRTDQLLFLQPYQHPGCGASATTSWGFPFAAGQELCGADPKPARFHLLHR